MFTRFTLLTLISYFSVVLAQNYIFNAGDSIPKGAVYTVPTGRLAFQLDGNLVIYDSNNVALWYTGTPGGRGCHLVFQPDGNFVMYDVNGAAWNSGTANLGGTRLVFQGDRNLVIYTSANKAVWNTGTFPH